MALCFQPSLHLRRRRVVGAAVADEYRGHLDRQPLKMVRNCDNSSHPACRKAGVMNLVQMSRSLSSFLFIEDSAGRDQQPGR